MIPQADHQEVSELLAAAALDVLEGAERLRVRQHVRECADCRRLLDQYEDLVAELAVLQPGTALDPDQSTRLRARLLARAGAGVPGTLAQAGHQTSARRPRWAVAAGDRWSGWLVAASLVGVLLMHHGFHQPLKYGWIVAGVLAIVCVALLAYVRVLYRRTPRARPATESETNKA